MKKTIKSRVKELLKIQKTAQDLLNDRTQGVPMQLVATTLKPIVDNWYNQDAWKFSSDKITVVRLSPRSTKYVDLVYFDEVKQAEQYVIVPNDFLFKTPTKGIAQKILLKYQKHCLKNISQNMSWTGGFIGSDPEIFAETEKGEIVPAFNFLGSKEKPSRAPERMSDNVGMGQNACYWDGFQAEFTTHASHCMGWHGDSIQCGLEGIWDHLKKFDPKAKLSIKTVFDIPPSLIQSSAPEHVNFGCMPSFNVYGMKGLDAPGNQVMYRAAGGHIHLGCGKLDKTVLERVVKTMDAILGVAGVSLFAKYDDPRRRVMYGLAGEYRLPPHGLEYRVLSNAWLFHPLMANIVFDLARGAYEFGKRDYLKFWDATEKETIEAINTCNVKLARKILARNKDLFIQVINMKYQNHILSSFVYDIVMNGAESQVADMNDIAENWKLGGNWKTHCDGKGKNVSQTLLNGQTGKYYKKPPKV